MYSSSESARVRGCGWYLWIPYSLPDILAFFISLDACVMVLQDIVSRVHALKILFQGIIKVKRSHHENGTQQLARSMPISSHFELV